MPPQVKNIIAISGSLKTNGLHHQYILAIASILTDKLLITKFDGTGELPHYNPEIDIEEKTPVSVKRFRELIKAADGVLICTPDYAFGVPGTLKNALDWTVRSGEFSKKPVALITASSLGHRGHESLLQTLTALNAITTNLAQVVIPFAKTKINEQVTITDKETAQLLTQVLKALLKMTKSK
jgi:chromate reductase, NAD(P)H dehydrogenase (quinone)